MFIEFLLSGRVEVVIRRYDYFICLEISQPYFLLFFLCFQQHPPVVKESVGGWQNAIIFSVSQQ